jgi:hypothetical protein
MMRQEPFRSHKIHQELLRFFNNGHIFTYILIFTASARSTSTTFPYSLARKPLSYHRMTKPPAANRGLHRIRAMLVTSLGRDPRTLIRRAQVSHEVTQFFPLPEYRPCGYAPPLAYLAQTNRHTPPDRSGRAGQGDGR